MLRTRVGLEALRAPGTLISCGILGMAVSWFERGREGGRKGISPLIVSPQDIEGKKKQKMKKQKEEKKKKKEKQKKR